MAEKKVGYKEPADYFTKEMLKVAREWDREHAKKQKEAAQKSTTTKKK